MLFYILCERFILEFTFGEMWNEWLIYKGNKSRFVSALKTTDGKIFESKSLQVDSGDVFLCPESIVPMYIKKGEDNDFSYYDVYEEGEWNPRQEYYDRWTFYDIRKKALLHYLCEEKSHYLFWESGKAFNIDSYKIFQWVLRYHHNEYLPPWKIQGMSFGDILKDLEAENSIDDDKKYILHYPLTEELHKIVILNNFYTIPEIKKAQKEYKARQNKHSDMAFFEFSLWLNPFPSEENPQISLENAVIAIGTKRIDLNDKVGTRVLKDEYEKFEHSDEEVKSWGNNAPNETIKWNFYLALRIIVSALDKSVWKISQDWEYQFKLEDIKNVYERYGDGIFRGYISNPSFTHNVGKRMKSCVNALLRRAEVWTDGDSCIQIDSIPKAKSPSNESGRYAIKKMKKMSRDGKKTTKDGKETKWYGKRRK